MNRLTIASLCYCSIASLASARDPKKLTYLMNLHDELVHKFDQEVNESNSGLFDKLWGKDEKKEDQESEKKDEGEQPKSDKKQS